MIKNWNSYNESILTQEQIEELSDIFVEIADEFGLNEAIDGRGSRPSDNGAWRLSHIGNGKFTELYIQINTNFVNSIEFEKALQKYLIKIGKKYHLTRLWWGDKYDYTFYPASRYMIHIESINWKLK